MTKLNPNFAIQKVTVASFKFTQALLGSIHQPLDRNVRKRLSCCHNKLKREQILL